MMKIIRSAERMPPVHKHKETSDSADVRTHRRREMVGRSNRSELNWIYKILFFAGGLATAVTVGGRGLGFGWFSLVAALPTFIASSVLVPVFLVIRDRRSAVKKRLHLAMRRRISGRRLSGPVPAVSIEAQAPLAESGGRVLATLPAAPL